MKYNGLVRGIMLSVILVFAAAGTARPQQATPSKKLRFGARIGVNVATISLQATNASESLESVTGFAAGLTLDYIFASGFGIHSGLEVSKKGFAATIGSDNVSSAALFIQLPVAFGYRFGVGQKWGIGPRLGLYFAQGVAGNTTVGSSVVSTFGDGKILNPFDCGVLVGAFFDNGRFVFGLHGELGITEANNSNFQVTGATAHNSNVSISVGYMF